jgi:hypothetical protein
VGINEVNDNLSSGKLYPNPARTVVYYESELNDNENGLLELYDMLGNKLSAYTLNHGKNKITIGTSGYARGVYMVKVNITDRQPEFIAQLPCTNPTKHSFAGTGKDVIIIKNIS